MSDLLERLHHGRSFSNTSAHPSGSSYAVRFNPPCHAGSGYEDAYLLASDLLVTTKHIRAVRSFREAEPGLGRLVFLFHLEGQRTVHVHGVGQYTLSSPTFAAYYQAEGVEKCSSWNEGDHETAVLIGFYPDKSPEVVRAVGESCLRGLYPGATGNGPFVWLQTSLSLEMERAARSILTPNVNRAVLQNYLTAKANELLCLALDAVISASDLTAAEQGALLLQTKLRRAREILEEKLFDVPPMATLARQVGLKPAVLSFEFRKAYDCRIAEYLIQRRMAKAYHLLTRSSMPLKQIAHTVGYDHTSNFCLTFKRYFRITPGQARLGGGEPAQSTDSRKSAV